MRLAGVASHTASSKGFDLCTWQNLPGKIMFVVTELNEVHDAEPDELPAELADYVLRLLAILHDVFGHEWAPRGAASKGAPVAAVGFIGDAAMVLWVPLKFLCAAVQCWRKGKRDDARINLEYALADLCLIADGLGVDIVAAAAAKLTKNAERPRLHGNVETLG